MWIIYSLIGAFGQALGAAFKKKALQTPGMNNVIGFVSFVFAGILFWAFFVFQSHSFWLDGLALRFWQAMFWYAGLNVVAVWFMYRALDLAEFNHLMPFMTLTSLTLIIPPIFILGEVPSDKSVFGIILVVVGVLIMNWQRQNTKNIQQQKANRKGVLYFLITALCFTITPTAAKITVQESSVAFASFLVHLLIGLGFLGLLFVSKELPKLPKVVMSRENRGLLVAILVAGAIIVAENGSINAALGMADVAYVFALKRLMPLFAFMIGIFYFKERENIPRKLIATVLLMIGAIIITIFK